MKKYILGLTAALALAATSCDDLEVDPTGFYSESVAYASVENLDMVVKYFYAIFYNVADIETGSGMTSIDDGVSDLLKASWYNVGAERSTSSSFRTIMSQSKVTSAAIGDRCTTLSALSTSFSTTITEA